MTGGRVAVHAKANQIGCRSAGYTGWNQLESPLDHARGGQLLSTRSSLLDVRHCRGGYVAPGLRLERLGDAVENLSDAHPYREVRLWRVSLC